MLGSSRNSDRSDWRTPAVMLLTVAVQAVPAIAQQRESNEIDTGFLEGFHKLGTLMSSSDWQGEQVRIERTIDNFWARSGWTDEPDLFARDVAREVAAIPPWRPMGRLDLLNARIAERYELDAAQSAKVKAAVMREAGRFLVSNAGVIFSQTQDLLETRSRGLPITADRVARWSTESRPLMEDLSKRVEALSVEFAAVVGPSGKKLLQQDIQSFRKRQKTVTELTQRWAAGKWTPQDWDAPEGSTPATPPKRPTLASEAVNQSPQSASQAVSRRWVAYDPSTWFAFVLVFETRFALDAGQKSAAESIHGELVSRAEAYQSVHSGKLKQIPKSQRTTHEAFAPIRNLFQELQSRLDAIPTSSQRHQADT